MKLSIVIPTYNEKENIQELLFGLKEEFNKTKIDVEIIVVDDNSPDGTGQVLDGLIKEYKNLKIIHRMGKLGLSSAIMEGFEVAEGEILGVMDADLSHPIQKMGEMYKTIIAKNVDMVIGSRYVRGGKIKNWSLSRKILSKGATLLARVFVNIKDPMSGFFMIKKEVIINKEINPKGFKILLELLIKTECKNIVETPITFTDRTAGTSKAGIKEVFYYLNNLIRYLPHKKEIILQFFKFALVGLIGTFINIFILYMLTEYFNIYYIISALFAFLVAMTANFIFNKTWTFSEKIYENMWKEYASFFVVSLLALSVNIFFLFFSLNF